MHSQDRLAYSPGPQQTRGAALIISLILLLVMTLLAISASNSTVMESKISANLTDRNTAFQAAEHALRQAEAQLIELISANDPKLTYVAPASGVTTINSNDTGIFNHNPAAPEPSWDLPWTNTNSIQDTQAATDLKSPDGTPLIAKNPRYQIVIYPPYAGAKTIQIDGTQQGAIPVTGQRFIITAKGWGLQPETEVTLQVQMYSGV
ncbi:MAG: hypothetical protein IE928_10545 [Gammaproteobacteria bacterium]|nr:hypothetical protein [Gammaproteobacteria bacterium]